MKSRSFAEKRRSRSSAERVWYASMVSKVERKNLVRKSVPEISLSREKTFPFSRGFFSGFYCELLLRSINGIFRHFGGTYRQWAEQHCFRRLGNNLQNLIASGKVSTPRICSEAQTVLQENTDQPKHIGNYEYLSVRYRQFPRSNPISFSLANNFGYSYNTTKDPFP